MHSDHAQLIDLQQYRRILETLQQARPSTLVAVSKTRSAAAISALYAHGQRHFGENQVPEALDKMEQLKPLDALQWHFIGQIQRNKTRAIAEHFHWVQSVDRELIIDRLATQRPAQMPALNVLIQVNIDAEPQKAGCRPDQLVELCRHVISKPGLKLRGLMAIPADSDDARLQRTSFTRLARCYNNCEAQGITLDTLSMGMSGDWQRAIESGSNMVRIGTAIFGSRN